MNLVIVESPTKAKTIGKFLDDSYQVESSFGHIRDLPERELGVDTANDFKPKYVIPAKAKPRVKMLQELAKKADRVILATDEDREGEAIAWHLAEALKIKPGGRDRIVFHEITAEAIQAALAKPRGLDQPLVDAQQARRVLDRLVGYELSPFLWKKVAKGLSAGRVQSVAVRLIVEREREIRAFVPQDYWTIEADLSRLDQAGVSVDEAKRIFRAKLHRDGDTVLEQLSIGTAEAADKIYKALDGATYAVAAVERKETKKNPPSPFTTSTLQQTANRWLGFSARDTMSVAQQLYEKGYITYMRTDSLNLSDKFLSEAATWLKSSLGDNYALVAPRRFKTKSKGAQEAHEAIRPVAAQAVPDSLASELEGRQLKLYRLIWQRAMASQMPAAVLDATVVDIDARPTRYQFRANGQVVRFDGYLKIYPEESKEVDLPVLKQDDKLELHELQSIAHSTKPPARYSDAGLVKALERYGIGRPSTYAPTIATIIERNYVQRDQGKRLGPTDIALVVNDLLVEHFPRIVDFEFTAQMETDLDSIAEGKKKWQPVIGDFYAPFHENLEAKTKEVKKDDIMPELITDIKCDKCGEPMLVKQSRYGKFLACSAFPKCRNAKPMAGEGAAPAPAEDPRLKELAAKYDGQKCDKCGEPMAVKQGRYGPFLACTAYPKCKNIKNLKETSTTGVKCPVCGLGEIVAKRSKRGTFYACDQYPECKTSFPTRPTGEKCPDCDSLLLEVKDGAKCANKDCGYSKQK